MNNISMIAAIGKNNELGKDNELIWHFKEDMKFFKEQTLGKPVIIGMKTLESLPKILPNRQNIVLTRRNVELDERILVFHSMEEILKYIEEYKEEVMIIGGASIYKQFLEYAKKLILTEIDDTKPADVYFPSFNKDDYIREVLSEHEENNIKYKHLIYTKK